MTNFVWMEAWRSDRFFGGRKQGTIIEEAAPISVRRDDEGVLLTFMAGIQTVTIRVPSYEILCSGDDGLPTVWRFEKPLRNGGHPTMKPIGLCARAIQNSSRPGEIVADFFGGSGSMLMAAEQTGRICNISEVDPIYCDVIVKRWE